MKYLLLFIFTPVISFSQAPSWEFVVKAGGTKGDNANAVAVDHTGNIFMAGSYMSPLMQFGNEVELTLPSNSPYQYAYLVKYNTNGVAQWAKKGVSNSNNNVCGVSSTITDSQGNVYIAGYFRASTIQFEDVTLTGTSNNNDDIFFVKYDTNGDLIWAKTFSSPGYSYFSDMVIDSNDNIYAVGYSNSSVLSLSEDILLSGMGSYDAIVVKIDSNGNALWGKRFGGYDVDEGRNIAIDATGDLYITGDFKSPITFDTETLTTVGGVEGFLVKLNANGDVIWAKSQTGTALEKGHGVTCDNNGYVYFSGTFRSPFLTIGNSTYPNIKYEDIFISKHDATTGVVEWGKTFGSNGSDFTTNILYDPAYGLLLTGNFISYTLTFGDTTLDSWSGGTYNDMYVTALNTDGIPLWAKSFGSNGIDNLKDVTVRNGVFYAVGEYGNTIYFDDISLPNTATNAFDVFMAKLNEGLLEIKENPTTQFSIYPNPAKNEVTLAFSEDVQDSKVEIFNMLGQKVKEFTMFSNTQNLDVSELQQGVYLFRISNNGTNETLKVYKQ